MEMLKTRNDYIKTIVLTMLHHLLWGHNQVLVKVVGSIPLGNCLFANEISPFPLV